MSPDGLGGWRVFVPNIGPGHVYGFRVDGPYRPDEGHRFNPHKLLLDPYARMITRPIRWHDALYGYVVGDPDGDESFDNRDSAPFAPRSVVVETNAAKPVPDRPRIPWSDTVIYEGHVKGLTTRHPEVPESLRGTYLGLCSPPILEHLRSLGVTAVQLLPVQQALNRRGLVDSGLTNYWGYDTIGYFSPDERFATAPGRQVREFQHMVRTLHEAGLEVILDVAYNHTAEGDQFGPTIVFRGIDNATYYRLKLNGPRFCDDTTGCGNTLNTAEPPAAELVLDSLRYWSGTMGVDGFRFDLATALTRDWTGRPLSNGLLERILEDPPLRDLKLIVEPWDLGPEGHQLGAYPPGFSEWNDLFRNTVRRFWRGDPEQVADLATRVAGSSDLFRARHRVPSAGINYVTCHDGFTLRDLVSYERKHNEANGEGNRDGSDDNMSLHGGVEAESDREVIVQTRLHLRRAMLATLALSRGVPMICAGDELSRTQRGNNNAYCQDNDTSWLNWDLDAADRAFLEFVRRLFALRGSLEMFRNDRFLDGSPVDNGEGLDVAWLRADGMPMTVESWRDPSQRTVVGLFHAPRPPAPDTTLHAPLEVVCIAFCSAQHESEWWIPGPPTSSRWCVRLHTTDPEREGEPLDNLNMILPPRSVVVLKNDASPDLVRSAAGT